MAGDTGESAVAVAEAGGAVQIRWLMAHVPGIAPVPAVVRTAGLPVTGAAKDIDLDRGQPLRILNRGSAARLDVSAPGSVTGLATDAELARLHLIFSAERDRPGRVTTKTAQRRRDGI